LQREELGALLDSREFSKFLMIMETELSKYKNFGKDYVTLGLNLVKMSAGVSSILSTSTMTESLILTSLSRQSRGR